MTVLITLSASYMLYRQEQQHKQHVATILIEAQSSLKRVQQNPYYQSQSIDTQSIVVEE